MYKLFNADEHKLHHQADGFPAARCVLVSLKEGWAKERTTEYSNLPREGDHDGTVEFAATRCSDTTYCMLHVACCVLMLFKGILGNVS